MIASAALVADSRRTGVLAVNIVTIEHITGAVAGAERAERPLILQLSENAIAYHGAPEPVAAAARAAAIAARVPVALHLDHITDESLALRAPELGFGSVMFDAAALPFAENVARTRAVTEALHAAGVRVEAELGEIGGKLGAHAPGVRTDPEEAAAFVADTGVDALAVAVGSQHAMTTRDAMLDLDLISRLASAVPVPLVLHGSSGVSDDGIRSAIAAGIVKVNVGTALGVAFTSAIRGVLDDPAVVDPRRYLAPARDAVAAEVERLLTTVIGAAR
ncbi:class II fructose-bisphosphate aldolase [Leucobacter rhizosphaerae]|uniref:Class II fructose-bisphosphate aldolase n=1 Tax=Leucobacter rhizosphaerae TaxID=2932245 RepID=A0ABY4FVY4_9MICO|nr:class II fructose-bisphosphate aldolase [Leucobacter rhizosphaerae]UOQ60468.1 class II fructose-bisphosphate aldolase [Leucobacter rhizosphaerae]